MLFNKSFMSDLLTKLVASLIVLVIGIPVIAWAFDISLNLKEMLNAIGPWVLVVMLITILSIIWTRKS